MERPGAARNDSEDGRAAERLHRRSAPGRCSSMMSALRSAPERAQEQTVGAAFHRPDRLPSRSWLRPHRVGRRRLVTRMQAPRIPDTAGRARILAHWQPEAHRDPPGRRAAPAPASVAGPEAPLGAPVLGPSESAPARVDSPGPPGSLGERLSRICRLPPAAAAALTGVCGHSERNLTGPRQSQRQVKVSAGCRGRARI